MTRPYRFLSTAGNSSSKAVPESPEEVSVESDFVVIFAALLCALVCIIGLIVIARCAWLRRGSIANRVPGQPSANKGIKKKFVDALPKFTYDSAKDNNGGKLSSRDCAICLAEYADGDEIRLLPQCGHGFHVGCIDKWLGSHSSCPSCRRILVITRSRCKKCGEFSTISAGTMTLVAEHEGRQHNVSTSSCSS
ncbi:probable E3 ubiquitin-protein ligase ATL44 [Cynara cardunculus var. scolymus]|uniref:probable E3 ubiquitin-protein ligase ATL44 n=1 Tax=Cynara cardunculus var. scolymus TaxID=59895 RepID=UPI000D630E53|nr:probable E3 ubiquitin-protein ligase ATL44 [Cynara cardunculus var. scolymus]